MLRLSISSNTNTNALLRESTASTPTKTGIQLCQSSSAKDQRFAVESATRFTQALKVSLLACSRSKDSGFVQHRSGCRKHSLQACRKVLTHLQDGVFVLSVFSLSRMVTREPARAILTLRHGDA
jgi:hypothetical protein